MKKQHAFISYVREDSDAIGRLARDLEGKGITVWLDRDAISPGERFHDVIRTAIEDGEFFIAIFSLAGSRRDTTYQNEELNLAIDVLRKKPRDNAWFIPVRLDDVPIPNWPIGAGETIRDLQYVDLFDNWTDAIERIATTIKRYSRTYAQRLIRDELGADFELFQAIRVMKKGINTASKDVTREEWLRLMEAWPEMVSPWITRIKDAGTKSVDLEDIKQMEVPKESLDVLNARIKEIREIVTNRAAELAASEQPDSDVYTVDRRHVDLAMEEFLQDDDSESAGTKPPRRSRVAGARCRAPAP